MDPLQIFAQMRAGAPNDGAAAAAPASFPNLSNLFQRPTIQRPTGGSVPAGGPGFAPEQNYFPNAADLLKRPAPVIPVAAAPSGGSTGGQTYVPGAGLLPADAIAAAQGGAGAYLTAKQPGWPSYDKMRDTLGWKHDGGLVSDDRVPGQTGGDVPEMLQEGEYVMTREAVQLFGADFFQHLNEVARNGQAATKPAAGGAPQTASLRS